MTYYKCLFAIWLDNFVVLIRTRISGRIILGVSGVPIDNRSTVRLKI